MVRREIKPPTDVASALVRLRMATERIEGRVLAQKPVREATVEAIESVNDLADIVEMGISVAENVDAVFEASTGWLEQTDVRDALVRIEQLGFKADDYAISKHDAYE